jgi:hypothetical protein
VACEPFHDVNATERKLFIHRGILARFAAVRAFALARSIMPIDFDF